jgi:tetratricopeptide (TPR) repeat protein
VCPTCLTASGAWYNRAATRYLKGDLDGALADFNRALQINPRYTDAWAQRRLARLLQGNEAAAERDFGGRLALSNKLKQSLERQIREARGVRALKR